MSMFNKLSAGGIAVVGRTGAGKSSLFHGSEYVLDVIIADTGSLAHRIHHRGGGTVTVLDPTDLGKKPTDHVRELVKQCEAESRLWVLDSWSALEWQCCAWFKAVNRKESMFENDHKVVVNWMRDLALTLATGHGFTLFNSSVGGDAKDENGKAVKIRKGALTGYPSLSGATPGTESVLARWSNVWVITPGAPAREDGTPNLYPRGIVLPWDDFRGNDVANYTPAKDGYAILQNGTIPAAPPRAELRMKVDPIGDKDTCHVDLMLKRIAEKYPDEKKAPKRRKLAADVAPSENGHVPELAPSGVE